MMSGKKTISIKNCCSKTINNEFEDNESGCQNISIIYGKLIAVPYITLIFLSFTNFWVKFSNSFIGLYTICYQRCHKNVYTFTDVISLLLCKFEFF